jgi:hypothetical protein
MRASRAFTAFAASYFAIVLLKDGTLGGVVKDLESAVNRTLKRSRALTKIT